MCTVPATIAWLPAAKATGIIDTGVLGKDFPDTHHHGDTMDFLRRIAPDNSHLEVDVTQVEQGIETQSHYLIDVRERDEWDDAHIEQAMLIPISEFEQRASEIPTDKPLHIMCHSGGRSLAAVKYLEQLGHKEPKSFAGGIVAWVGAGKPVVR